ncbi:MAG: adenylate/guanylate cyclase domain-containing protein [Gammaproteobacteria bacterium]|nr:adenylate/guanylate cyclase domain-containing protein [Gammaproteobacteria bacterium]
MLEKRLRLWSGLVLAVYVIPHLTNHSLGIWSFDAMEGLRQVLSAWWRSPLGTVLLYGSFLTHFALALYSLWRRTTLRMPVWEAVQLAMGLLIVPLLAGHIIGTRVAATLLDIETTYPYVVTALWSKTYLTIKQPILLLVVWIHVAVGMHFWLRLKSWYPKAIPFLYPAAVLLPVLALLGYVRAGVATREWTDDPERLQIMFADWFSADPDTREFILGLEPVVVWWIVGLIAAVVLLRECRRLVSKRHGAFRVAYPSGKVVAATLGQTLLEAVRAAGVPHASVCGGRARCTTCRVRVGEGLEQLPKPSQLEQQALTRISAEPNVRLACQLCPTSDLLITPLLPPNATVERARRPGGVQGHEQRVAVMFIDLRGSTRLGEQRMPYDVVFILNQFFAEMSEALKLTDGHYAQFNGDGLMALYGLHSSVEQGCRAALQGAVQMCARLATLNRSLEQELDQPLRIGIGIHSGEAIVGTMGPPAAPILSAIGDNINIASRLEALTKEYQCSLVVSAVTAGAAGVDLSDFPSHNADVRGRSGPVAVYAIKDPADIRGLSLA